MQEGPPLLAWQRLWLPQFVGYHCLLACWWGLRREHPLLFGLSQTRESLWGWSAWVSVWSAEFWVAFEQHLLSWGGGPVVCGQVLYKVKSQEVVMEPLCSPGGCQHFFLNDSIVSFCVLQGSGDEAQWALCSIVLDLQKHCSSAYHQGVCSNNCFALGRVMSKDRGRFLVFWKAVACASSQIHDWSFIRSLWSGELICARFGMNFASWLVMPKNR